MDERVKFIAAMLEGSESFTALCELFGISRKQGYKWKARYESGGVDALRDRSRAPKSRPQALNEQLVELIVKARNRHPNWGPRKLLVILARQYPELDFPAASTIGDLLKKQGLVGRKRRRLRSAGYAETLGGYDYPNAIWCADFKGQSAKSSISFDLMKL